MTNVKIEPCKLTGKVTVPPSKSLAHRAVICAALADGKSRLTNIQLSDDIIATAEAMKIFGATIEIEPDGLSVQGIGKQEKKQTERTIDCNESGSTLRFLLPLAALFDSPARFTGKGNLGSRPLTIYQKIFEEQGIAYQQTPEILDFIVNGKLKAGSFKLEGNVSSQFITGLLFVLPLLNGDSSLILTTPLESKGYVDLTLAVLENFGIQVHHDHYRVFKVRGNQHYQTRNCRIEGDYSQAAFFLCADALGSRIHVNGLESDSLQGDKAVLDILGQMGVAFSNEHQGILGTVKHSLSAATVDASQCPDIIPVVSLVAALSKGRTVIANAGRLRIKESDRLAAVAKELNALGASIIEKPDGLIIDGVHQLKGGATVWSHKDHRMAMMLAIAATVCKEPVIIKDSDCVAKSYPGFWKDFNRLGGKAIEWNLGQ